MRRTLTVPLLFSLATLSFLLGGVTSAEPPILPEDEKSVVIHSAGSDKAKDLQNRSVEVRRGFLELADGSVDVIRYEVLDGVAVWGGDMLLSLDERGNARIAAELDRLWNERSSLSAKSTGIKGASFVWPNNTVYYLNQTVNEYKPNVEEAIDHWEATTSLRFVTRTNQTDYVAFITMLSPQICDSHVGRQGGRQLIRLASVCSVGNIKHEIGHAVGLFHEHQRPDRDNFVTVYPGNVESGKEHNFDKYSFGTAQTLSSYDFGSIMHYGSCFFSKDLANCPFANPPSSLATILKKNGSMISAQRNGLSALDISGILSRYRRILARITFECYGGTSTCAFAEDALYGARPLVSATWTFSDTSIPSNGAVVEHTFPGAGTYGVTLQVVDSKGDQSWASTTVTVEPNCGLRVC